MPTTDDLRGLPVFCSWSGGKDSALALHEAVAAGAMPRLLVTMLTEDRLRSRSHGLHRRVLEAQAAAVGLPIQFGSATWAGYEAAFRTEIETAAAAGVTTGIFGDIDLQEHREWIEAVCSSAGVSACLPLWQRPRTTVVEELLDARVPGADRGRPRRRPPA